MINKTSCTLLTLAVLLLVPTVEAMQRKNASSSAALAAPSSSSSPYEEMSIQSLIKREAELRSQIDHKLKENHCHSLYCAHICAGCCAVGIGLTLGIPPLDAYADKFATHIGRWAILASLLACVNCCERKIKNTAKDERTDFGNVQDQIRSKKIADLEALEKLWNTAETESMKQD